MTYGPKPRSAWDRFWEKVEITGACWLWTAGTNHGGYGFFNPERGKPELAHRYAYKVLVGDIGEGLHLDHLCRIRNCVNPDHLEPVPPATNYRRSPLWSGNRTHCKAGHELAGDNVIWQADGRRKCRACDYRRQAERREADREGWNAYHRALRAKYAAMRRSG